MLLKRLHAVLNIILWILMSIIENLTISSPTVHLHTQTHADKPSGAHTHTLTHTYTQKGWESSGALLVSSVVSLWGPCPLWHPAALYWYRKTLEQSLFIWRLGVCVRACARAPVCVCVCMRYLCVCVRMSLCIIALNASYQWQGAVSKQLSISHTHVHVGNAHTHSDVQDKLHGSEEEWQGGGGLERMRERWTEGETVTDRLADSIRHAWKCCCEAIESHRCMTRHTHTHTHTHTHS